MLIPVSLENIAFFEALASEVRLKVIKLLTDEELNIKELSQRVGISSPIMLKHIKKLEEVGLVTTRMVRRNGSMHKICTMIFPEALLVPPKRERGSLTIHEIYIPVGHYSNIQGVPTCGIATVQNVIGQRDDPRMFYAPERMNAQLLWFSRGFVEYVFPNYLSPEQQATEIEISFEISSEAPDFKDEWPSDIIFSLNGITLCTWTSPGDFGLKRGILTPEWWTSNQYGQLKVLRITPSGVLLDDQHVSDVTLEQVLNAGHLNWTLRFEVAENSQNVGGLTLFGKDFGNHNRDILVRTFYLEKEMT